MKLPQYTMDGAFFITTIWRNTGGMTGGTTNTYKQTEVKLIYLIVPRNALFVRIKFKTKQDS
jgi:hypothetical protein